MVLDLHKGQPSQSQRGHILDSKEKKSNQLNHGTMVPLR